MKETVVDNPRDVIVTHEAERAYFHLLTDRALRWAEARDDAARLSWLGPRAFSCGFREAVDLIVAMNESALSVSF